MEFGATMHVVCSPTGHIVVSLFFCARDLLRPAVFVFFLSISHLIEQGINILKVPLSRMAQTAGCLD